MAPAAVGLWFDGQTAARQDVGVQPSRDLRGIVIQPAQGSAIVWPLDRLRAVEDPAKDRLTITLLAETEDESPRDPSRLVISDPALIAWLRGATPKLLHRDLRPGTTRKVVVRIAGAALAIAVILFVFLPRISDALAENLPLDREVAFGDAVVGQMERLLSEGADIDLTCASDAGARALETLRLRLTNGQNLRYPLRLRVFDHPMVNAFAAPGGQVVILRGLLDEAESADEVAGVLAHEIGHVEARDATRLAFRSAGSAGILSLLLGDASGGFVIALLGDHLLSAAYTREAEAKADTFAHSMLARAGISPQGMAAFFDRIDKIDGDLPSYLSTHPASEERAALARAARTGTTTPALSAEDWRALQSICTG